MLTLANRRMQILQRKIRTNFINNTLENLLAFLNYFILWMNKRLKLFTDHLPILNDSDVHQNHFRNENHNDGLAPCVREHNKPFVFYTRVHCVSPIFCCFMACLFLGLALFLQVLVIFTLTLWKWFRVWNWNLKNPSQVHHKTKPLVSKGIR